MDELTAFITARLGEIEATAKRGYPSLLAALLLRCADAQRAILARHKRVDFDGRTWCEHCTSPGAENEDLVAWPCPDVRDLAAVANDHPEYRAEEWGL